MRWLVILFALVLGVADAFSLFGGYEPYGAFWNRVPFSDAVIGAVGGGALILLATRWLKPLLGRPEEHYRDGP